MIVSQTIPIITIAPLLVIWLGFGMGPKIAIVVLICFFPVCMSLLQGLSQIDRDYMDLMKTMGAVIAECLGAKLGAFSREDKLTTEDFEMLVAAEKYTKTSGTVLVILISPPLPPLFCLTNLVFYC